LIAVIAIAVTFITELTSNTAITNLILPILATGAVAFAIEPSLIMIPATLSASCAFMMPIASPTQTIIFGTGYVSIKQMMRAGIWFNILGIVLVVLVFSLIAGLL
jgi:sodium-dependent dicarboxylate transporter 2/3/5